MIGVIIATHGKMADGLLDSIELIVGKQKNCITLCLRHGDDIELFRQSIKDAIIKLSEGDGVIIFADLFAASPYNQAARIYPELKEYPYRLVTGVNLPMLIETMSKRMVGDDLETIVTSILETGKDGIKEFFTELKNKR